MLVGADIWWFASKPYTSVDVCRVDSAIVNVIVYLAASLRGC